jgi:hypothetical protein
MHRKDYCIGYNAKQDEYLNIDVFRDEEEWLSPFLMRNFHLIFGLRVYDIHAIFDPLFLSISQHIVLSHQFLLSVVL